MRSLLIALALTSTASISSAGVVTITMQDGNGGGGAFNTVAFAVSHASNPGVTLTQMTFNVGDTQYLYDQLYLSEELFVGGNGTQTAILLIGDRTDDNAGPDAFSYGFTNFGSSITFRGQWDIDNDNGDFNADARTVMFNNGAAPNAVATFTFSDSSVIAFSFPDVPLQPTYSFTIPAPAPAAMLGLAVVACTRRRHRR